MIDLFLMMGMFKLLCVLLIHYLWCINSSNEEFIHETDEHIYLKIPHGIPVQYQYPMRAGYPPGTLGTEISALIIPPENNAKSELIYLYTNITEYKELISTNKTRITDFHFKFYENLVKLYNKQSNAKQYNKKIFSNLVLKPSNARLQFMMYYCTARLEFTKNITDDIVISSVNFHPMIEFTNTVTAAPETTAASNATAAPSVVAPSNAVVPANAATPSNSTAPSNATVSSDDSIPSNTSISHNTTLHLNTTGPLNMTSTKKRPILSSQYDIHQFCPKACAYREGSGFSDEHRSQLNRYNNLCNFPSHFMSTLSKRCSEENYLGLVHLQSFKCECSTGFVWKEQLKSCYLPYGWRQKAERLKNTVSIRRNDRYEYFNENKCSRIGTKSILPIEANTKYSKQQNRDKMYHTERCICKDEFYGTYCDKRKDPCKMPIGNVIMGDIACRVNDGNKCIPNKEYGIYTCQCTKAYKKLVNNSTLLPRERVADNCLVRIDPCLINPCKHGICVMSDFGSIEEEKAKRKGVTFSWFGNQPDLIARCICDDGWRGERCSFPVSKNVWSLWSSWSFCEPSCQSSFTEVPPNHVPENWKYGVGTGRWGMRQRSRYRDCLSKASDCNAEIDRMAGFRGFINKTEVTWRQYEYRGCRPRPCDRHLYLASGTRAVQRSQLSGQVIRNRIGWCWDLSNFKANY
ncbi:unnamed protein product [Trichobilharzia szidati]|nr:unnamed protein product [Trichobilharzia szidati]